MQDLNKEQVEGIAKILDGLAIGAGTGGVGAAWVTHDLNLLVFVIATGIALAASGFVVRTSLNYIKG